MPAILNQMMSILISIAIIAALIFGGTHYLKNVDTTNSPQRDASGAETGSYSGITNILDDAHDAADAIENGLGRNNSANNTQ